MKNYTKFNRGSEWRKWDIHIHTPETKKNDQFEGSNPDEKWSKFIEAVNSSTEQISVVGIADYLSIENFFVLQTLTFTSNEEREISVVSQDAIFLI